MTHMNIINYCKHIIGTFYYFNEPYSIFVLISFLTRIDLQKCWALCMDPHNSKMISIGYDEGTVIVKIGGDEPKASLM
jgi:hypothetical protein